VPPHQTEAAPPAMPARPATTATLLSPHASTPESVPYRPVSVTGLGGPETLSGAIRLSHATP
jgi:hypothetical protein